MTGVVVCGLCGSGGAGLLADFRGRAAGFLSLHSLAKIGPLPIKQLGFIRPKTATSLRGVYHHLPSRYLAASSPLSSSSFQMAGSDT
jgi:hypothetical protein